MHFVTPNKASEPTDLLVIGSGFGALFFAHKFLQRHPTKKITILEWGSHKSLSDQIKDRKNSDKETNETFVNNGTKPWNFSIGLGGSSNCWWALTPRLHPNDFNLHTHYGVGTDWPINYDHLASYYSEAERIMMVAGPDDLDRVYPGVKRYSQPAHRMTSADKILKAASPDAHFALPSAKLSQSHQGRGRCCSAGTCNLCPTDARFSLLNGMREVLSHPNVRICLNAEVKEIDLANNLAGRVYFQHDEQLYAASGDLVALGAGAIHAPFILTRSGDTSGALGRYLGEKLHATAEIKLEGLKHFDGGSVTTAFNVSLLDGDHRRDHGAVLYMTDNHYGQFGLRRSPNRWREVMPVTIFVEDIPDAENRVIDGGLGKPVVQHSGYSEYALKGFQRALEKIPEVFEALPIESVSFHHIHGTANHVQGTVRMGMDPETSVVDDKQVHHKYRNLVVVGTSVFPTIGTANPTLTASALSLRAAEAL